MKCILRSLTLLAVFLAAATTLARQVTIGAARDTTIYQSQPARGNSLGVGMFAGQDPGGTGSSKRGMIGFDIEASGIPSGSIITSVVLELTLGQVAGSGGGTGGGGDQTPRQIDLHRISNVWPSGESWAEGTSGTGNTMIGGSGQGFAASNGESTWSSRTLGSTLWNAAAGGSDFSATISAWQIVGNPGNTTTVFTWGTTPALVADVQAWLDNPDLNHGWLVKANDEDAQQSFRAFFTSNAAEGLQPSLIINYVPEPSTLVSLGIGAAGLGLVARRRRKAACRRANL